MRIFLVFISAAIVASALSEASTKAEDEETNFIYRLRRSFSTALDSVQASGSKTLRRATSITISSIGKQLFSYESSNSASSGSELPTAHTFITSDPNVRMSVGQSLAAEGGHDDLETLHAEKKEIKAELKDIKHEEKVLKNEKSPNLTDQQRSAFSAEQKIAREGESELLNRWMTAPTYAPVASLSDMKKAAVERARLGTINSKEAVAKLLIKPPPGKEELNVNKKRYPLSHTFDYEYYRVWDKVRNITYGHAIPSNKYYLSIIAMFKNEAITLKEWIDHHIGHGVDHFYLVDDGSTDNPMKILKPYVESGIVSMFPTAPRNIPFRQAGLYKKLFTEIYAANESHWIAMIDVDEYLYSPIEPDIRKVLRQHDDLSLIGLNWVMFGSSHLVKQPKSVVQSFVYRADYNASKYPALIDHYKILKWTKGHYSDWQKNIVNTRYRVDNIDVHVVTIEGTTDNLSYKRYPTNPPLLLNHYVVQSHEYFLNVKAQRGDVNNFVYDEPLELEWFKACDINDIKDTRLADQNLELGLLMK